LAASRVGEHWHEGKKSLVTPTLLAHKKNRKAFAIKVSTLQSWYRGGLIWLSNPLKGHDFDQSNLLDSPSILLSHCIDRLAAPIGCISSLLQKISFVVLFL
jgi:hypothetical protein